MRIVLGVGGGIAAYKVASLLRLFTEAGHDVTVIPTEAATRFVGVATWEALSGIPVSNSVFDDVAHGQPRPARPRGGPDRRGPGHRRPAGPRGHRAGQRPADQHPADGPRPGAHGPGHAHRNVAARGHPGQRGNAAQPGSHRAGPRQRPADRLRLRPRPAARTRGHLSRPPGADPGRFGTAVPDIRRPLAGRTVTISAGGTREPLDPVRFLGNRSSGKQGVALAVAARERRCHRPAARRPHGRPGARRRRGGARGDCPANCARPPCAPQPTPTSSSWPPPWRTSGRRTSPAPRSKNATTPPTPSSRLVRNPDILQELVELRDAGPARRQLIVGFAAETGDADGDVLAYAQAKLRRKGCDLLVVNHVGQDQVFGQDTNSVVILSRTGSEPQEASGSKTDVAAAVIGPHQR